MVTDLIEIGPMDAAWHAAFFRFVSQTLQEVEFAPWAARDGWDESYTIFAMIEDGEIVSTVGRSAMRLIVDGQLIDAYQLSSVVTRRDRRNRGYLRRLMEHVLGLPPLDDRPVFLFANDAMKTIYPRFGFVRVAQRAFSLAVDFGAPTPTPADIVDLDQCAERALLSALCLRARPLSQDFCARDYYTILLWHLTCRPALKPVRLADLDAVVVVSTEGDRVTIHDILAPRTFSPLDVLDRLDIGRCVEIRFGFNPTEWLAASQTAQGLALTETALDSDDNPFFSRGRPSPRGRVSRFPELAQT